ncbi:MAG: flagellar biosynthetic protein FliO [Polyangiaceae bacterium]|jgi:flagellar biogenesis protein FliO
MKARHAAAIALAGAVMALTASVCADEVPSATGGATGTPLTLRPSKPLEVAKEPQHGLGGWPVVALIGALGGAALWLRKKRAPGRENDARLTIVRRAPVGFRSELVVVEVEGQRLLLGVTPQSIQSLAILGAGDDEAEAPAAASSPVGERFGALLDAASPDRRPGRASSGSTRSAPLGPPVEAAQASDDIAGQARGLLALRGRR